MTEPIKILIADDEPNIVVSLEFLMKREGHQVLVARDGRVVVTDFGLARVEDGAVTSRSAPGVVSGTPAYLAPEQLTAASVDARVDQFAWAVMAWELLAGERPFPVEPAARLASISSIATHTSAASSPTS